MMRNIAVISIVCVAMFCGAAVSAQSTQQLEALSTASKQWTQGNFTDVGKTLAAHRNPETDAELQQQVETFLESQASEKAVMTALMIDSEPLRNSTLLSILYRQLYAKDYMPEKFDMMLGKAEKTAQFLEGGSRDAGYAAIAVNYFNAGKSDLAWEAVSKMDAERYFTSVASRSWYSIHLAIYNGPVTHEKMLENAARYRELIGTIQSPATKATLLMNLVVLYTERTNEKVSDTLKAELKQKRLEILEEATPLLLSLPDDADKVRQLRQTGVFYLADGREDEAKALSPVILAIIGNMEGALARFHFYAELLQGGHPNAAEILEKMHAIAEETDRVDFWRNLFSAYSVFVGLDRYNPQALHQKPVPDAIEILEKMEGVLARLEKKLVRNNDGFHQFFTNSQATLFQAYSRLYHPDQPDVVRWKILAAVERVEDTEQRFQLYKALLRPYQPDVDGILDKMRLIAEDTQSHQDTILALEYRLPIPPDAELKGHTQQVRSVRFSPDETKIVTASRDGTARIWDAESGELLHLLSVHEFDPRGPATPSSPCLREAVFSPDGKTVLTRDYGGVLQIWDVESGEELRKFRAPGWGTVDFIVFSPDGKKILTCGDRVNIWDAESGKLLRELYAMHSSGIPMASFSPDGKNIVTANLGGTATIWDAESGEELYTIGKNESRLFTAVYSPDGKKIVTASDSGTARIWDADTREQLHHLGAGRDRAAAFSPDGKKIITSGGYSKSPQIWDTESGKELLKLDDERHKQSGTISAVFSSDGKKVFTVNYRNVQVWDAESGKELQRFGAGGTQGMGAIESAALSPDGKKVALACPDHIVRIWNLDRVPAPPASLPRW